MLSRRFLFFIIGFLFAIGGIVVFVHQPPPAPQSLPTNITTPPAVESLVSPTLPMIAIKNITLHETDKNKKYELIVTAEESTFHHIDDSIECNHVTCSIVHNGAHIAALSAEKSLLNRLAHCVTLTGLVKGTLKELGLYGCDITYNFSTQTVSTDKTTTYTHPQFLFSAQKSFVYVNEQKIEMSGGVHSEFFMSHDMQHKHLSKPDDTAQ